MKPVKILLKAVLLPVLAVIMLIQWAAIFLNSVSSVVMSILAFIITLTGAVSLIFRLASGGECLRMLSVAFAVFLVPHIGNWLIERIIFLRCLIGDYLRS